MYMSSTSHHAGAFGARGTPGIMRLNEIMGIEANRTWGVCSLNEFRKFLGLKSGHMCTVRLRTIAN